MFSIKLNLRKMSLAKLGGWFRMAELGYFYGQARRAHRVTSVTFKYRGTDVLLLVKKTTPAGPRIAYIDGPNAESCLEMLAYYMDRKQLRWKEDEWELKRLGENR